MMSLRSFLYLSFDPLLLTLLHPQLSPSALTALSGMCKEAFLCGWGENHHHWAQEHGLFHSHEALSARCFGLILTQWTTLGWRVE